MELGDLVAAKAWFERSAHLEGPGNPTAWNYLKIVHNQMLEAATNDVSAKLIFPTR